MKYHIWNANASEIIEVEGIDSLAVRTEALEKWVALHPEEERNIFHLEGMEI